MLSDVFAASRDQFTRSVNRPLLNVTVCGLAPEIKTSDLLPYMREYGKIEKSYDVYKNIDGYKIKNGNRVFQYLQLTELPPTKMMINDRSVRLVYSNDKKFFSSELLAKIDHQHQFPP